jgi:predicted transposase YdaD
MRMEHDASYKLLISHSRMVEDLLRGFINEPWVQEVDFTTLERVSGSYVSDDLRDREDDIIWRVRRGSDWLYVYLLLEFQSTVDPYMALRLLVYIGLLYQSLIRAKQLPASGKLPPVIPIVLYNGRRRWTAPRDVSTLSEDSPGGLTRYKPRLRYALLEERRYTERMLAPLRNLVAALFLLENSREPEEVQRVLEALVAWVRTPEDDSLRRAFAFWLRRVLLPARLPAVPIPEMHDLREVQTMLAERVVEWTQRWKESGLREGRRAGRQEGLREGRQEGLREGQLQEARAMVLEAVRVRFGEVPDDITAAVQQQEARSRLHTLLRQAMTCPSLDAFRDALRTGQS